ncbi:hypothetical protein VTO42DRAFT_2147 [Malbranchea cinnamomea]
MGNTPSKSPPGQSGLPAGGPTPQSNDSKMQRRKSIQALSGGKASAADPSATKESVTGQRADRQHIIPVHQRLQSRGITETPTTATHRLERRDSRKERERPDSRTSANARNESYFPEPSRAVQVPHTSDRSATQRPPLNTYYATPSHLSRPPRLPLPIGDAMSTPGSPITVSGSIGAVAAFDKGNLDVYHDRSSSADAVDDDEITDELEPYPVPGVSMTVPTTVEWHGGGEKVYVTGTFVNWARKFRLHKSELEDGTFSATLQLRPGTHHLKYIVDGVMRTADHLPTAVDFTNHLVNYIEVSPDDVQRTRRENERQAKIRIPSDIYPPKVIPESVHLEAARQAEEAEESDRLEPEEEIPMGDFRAIIPQFLMDLDGEEHDSAYQQAANIVGDYPTPPMLPLFLGRSILNGTSPAKDNSVLSYPNHTVLNHLATSSIKNGVLATSATTRYKRKYVTTILYKPAESS